MEWEVEHTDEFGVWWAGLSEAEQEDIAAVVELLEEKALSYPIVPGFTGQSTRTCASCESSMRGDLTERFMPSTPGGQRSPDWHVWEGSEEYKIRRNWVLAEEGKPEIR